MGEYMSYERAAFSAGQLDIGVETVNPNDIAIKGMPIPTHCYIDLPIQMLLL